VRALCDAGTSKIFIINRTFEKAAALAVESAPTDTDIIPIRAGDPAADSIFDECDVIINSTSLGLNRADPPPLDPSRIRPEHTVIDLIYKPRATRFLEAGAARGARVFNGYGMLVFQAAEAFKLWTGVNPPIDVMWNAGLEGI